MTVYMKLISILALEIAFISAGEKKKEREERKESRKMDSRFFFFKNWKLKRGAHHRFAIYHSIETRRVNSSVLQCPPGGKSFVL